MEKTEIYISNYKLHKELHHEFKPGNLYFIEGKNKTGKTSFIDLIVAMFQAKAASDNTISFGEEQGEVRMKIINFKGKLGEDYILKYELGKNDKFTLIMPNGDIKKKVSEIRDIFKYQEMSVDEFFGLGLTADGRKKQAKFIKNVMPENIINRMSEIDVLINEKSGSKYKERTEANSMVTSLKSLIENSKLTDEEVTILGKKDAFTARTLEIKKELSRIEQKKVKIDANSNVAQLNLLEKDKIESSEDMKRIANEIDELTSKLERLKSELTKKAEKITNIDIEIAKLQNQETEKLSNDEITFLNNAPSAIEKRELQMKTIDNISMKYTNFVKQKEQLETAIDKAEKLDKEITELTLEKQNLLESTELPIKNLTFIEDEVFYIEGDNLIPFTEKTLSYATGGKEVIKLMCEINRDVPIIVIGKAAEYDEESLDDLKNLAVQYNKILFCDYVVPNKDFTITCYEK